MFGLLRGLYKALHMHQLRTTRSCITKSRPEHQWTQHTYIRTVYEQGCRVNAPQSCRRLSQLHPHWKHALGTPAQPSHQLAVSPAHANNFYEMVNYSANFPAPKIDSRCTNTQFGGVPGCLRVSPCCVAFADRATRPWKRALKHVGFQLCKGCTAACSSWA